MIDSITFDGEGNVEKIILREGVKHGDIETAISTFIDNLTKKEDYADTVKWMPSVGRLNISKGNAKDGSTYYKWNFQVWVTTESIHYIIAGNASGFMRGQARDKQEKAIEDFVINECEQAEFMKLTFG